MRQMFDQKKNDVLILYLECNDMVKLQSHAIVPLKMPLLL